MLYDSVMAFAVHPRGSAIGEHVSPTQNPASLSILPLSVAPEQRLREPCSNSAAFFVSRRFGSLPGMLTLLPFLKWSQNSFSTL